MKFLKVLMLIILQILIISCSNGKSIENDVEDVQTLKALIKEKEQNKTWTKEIEGNLLGEPLTDAFVTRNYAISDEAFKTVYNSHQPVYPEIKDFGSLDISSLDGKSLTILKNFCNIIKSDYSKAAGDYFNSKYIFNAVFFFNALESNWESQFKEKFPEAGNNSTVVLFDNYFIGKPDFSQNDKYAEVPVLFFSKNRKLYVKILINPEDEKIIYQVLIERWESVND